MSKGQRSAAKEALWRRLLKRWRRSGLSVREYCYQHGLSEPSFYAWRREIALRDQEGVAASDDLSSSLFLPVRVQAESVTAAVGAGAIEVVLGNGRSVRVASGFDAATLRQVLAVLEAPAC